MLTVAGALAVSCEKNDLGQNSEVYPATISLNPGVNDYTDAMRDSSQAEVPNAGDAYHLQGIRFDNGKLIATVGYGGGCGTHSFEVQGKISLEFIHPPNADIVIIHQANGDNCEAYVTEDIEIDLHELLGSDSVNLRIFNPSQIETRYASLSTRHLKQGVGCNVDVSFEEVVCGSGIYGNNWFAIEGEDLYLQPLLINFSIDDSQLTEGKQYKVGFWETIWHGDSTPVCLAYPGPSVMAEISCIEEI